MVRGFTSGAAILILLSQFPSTLGMAAAGESGLVGNTIRVLGSPGSWNLAALALTVLTVAITLLARRIHPLFPGALVAVLGGVLFSVLAGYQGPIVGDIPGSLPPISLGLPLGMFPALVVPGVVIALVGFAETTAIARSFAHPGPGALESGPRVPGPGRGQPRLGGMRGNAGRRVPVA